MFRLVSMVLLFLTCAWGEDKATEKIRQLRLEMEQVKRENAKLDAAMTRTDSLKSAEAARFAELEKNYARDLERRQSEIADLKTKLQQANRKIQKEKGTQAGYRNKTGEQAALEKVLREGLIKHCLELEEEVGRSLPWDREVRAERVRVLKRDLEAGTASLEEGFNRLTALYASEIASGDEIALLEKPVTRNDGETVNASVLKIGNQWLVYADEERKKFGVLEKTTAPDGISYTWREELSFTERQAVRDALEVKMAKKPPRLVSLPLTLSLNPSQPGKGGQ